MMEPRCLSFPRFLFCSALIPPALLVCAGCGGDSTVAADPGHEAPVEPVCPPGQIVGPEKACMPVGLQGCSELFVGDDKLCHPTMAACPPGQIPKFDEGCVPVGIPGCDPRFVREDGLCHPTFTLCPEGTFALPQEGCVPIDGPDGCGPPPWGNLLDAPGTVYVDPSYGGGDGDGSRQKPFATLAAASAQVAAQGTIALADGVYSEPLSITRSITLAGRCPSRVRLAGRQPGCSGAPAAVVVDGPLEVTIRGVQIDGAAEGVCAMRGAQLELDRVHIQGGTRFGAWADGPSSRIAISHGWIEGASTDLEAGGGVVSAAGAAVTVASSAVTGRRIVGIGASGRGARIDVTGSLIERTRPPSGRSISVGVAVDHGAELTIEDSAIVDNTGVGLWAEDAGTRLVASGVLVEHTQLGDGSVAPGIGVGANKGAIATVGESVLADNASEGATAREEGSYLTLTSSLVQDSGHGRRHGELGGGVVALKGGRVTLEDNAFFRNHLIGLALEDAIDVVIEGNLVEGTLGGVEGRDGAGGLFKSSRATVAANAFVDNHYIGVAILGSGAEIELTGNLVENTLPRQSDGQSGHGMEVAGGAVARLASNLFTKNRDLGVAVTDIGGRAELTMTGDLVQKTSPDEVSGRNGVGLYAVGADLTVTSAVVRESTTSGLTLFAAQVRLQKTIVDRVFGGRFELASGEKFEGIGDGILSLANTVTDMTDVQVTGCLRVGVIYDSSTGTIERTSATNNRFGLVLQGSPQPTFSEDCSFEGNTEAGMIPGGEMPVPDSPIALP